MGFTARLTRGLDIAQPREHIFKRRPANNHQIHSALFPERGGKPYLWQDILLQRPSGELVLTMVITWAGPPLSSCTAS